MFEHVDFLAGEGEGTVASNESNNSGVATPLSVLKAPSVPTTKDEILTAMHTATVGAKRSAPEPDRFAKSKRRQDEEFMKSMVSQSHTLTSVTKQLGEAISAPPAPERTAPVYDPMVGTIKLALDAVPPEKKIQCVMAILELITTKFGPNSG